MTAVIINPGTGPVEGATLDHAYKNMLALLKDAGLKDATFTRDAEAKEEGGRFAFLVHIAGAERFGPVSVDMPGIPLARVRWLDKKHQNIWGFPRLYVDGSSWVWKFAVGILADWLQNREAGEEEERRHLLQLRRERTGDTSSNIQEGLKK
jgi:hypothetical protein